MLHLVSNPKTGIIATLFPTDYTWHPLYNHSYSEITSNMNNARNSKNTPQLELIENVVKQSYTVRARSGFIISSIITFILLIIVLTSKNKEDGNNTFILFPSLTFITGHDFYFWMTGIMTAITISIGINWMYIAKKRGNMYWENYLLDSNQSGENGTQTFERQKKAEENAARTSAISQSNTSGYNRFGSRNGISFNF
jgi:hypothetical protein